MTNGRVLLSGIVGSTAYGLATEESDVDRLGVYAAPSGDFLGLHPPTGKSATRQGAAPDVAYHEVGKFLTLCLGCNPTVSELLWLPDRLYEVRTELGEELIGLRQEMLSARRVRDAYLGYATSQLARLVDRGRFPDVPVARIEKHARHLLRILDQGLHLYGTGELRVRVDDPARCFQFGRDVRKNPELARWTINDYEVRFDAIGRSPLPDRSDEGAVDRWLRRARRALLERADGACGE